MEMYKYVFKWQHHNGVMMEKTIYAPSKEDAKQDFKKEFDVDPNQPGMVIERSNW